MINRSTLEKDNKRDTLDDEDLRNIIQKVENGGNLVEEEVIEHNESGKNSDFFAVHEERANKSK